MTQEEFKKLFDMHFATVRRYVLYRSGDQEIATDIAQDTFLRLWERQPEVDHSRVRGLLFKISNDLYISRFRKEKRAFEFFKNFVLDTEDHSPEEILQFNQLKSDYDKALKDMPEIFRTVFLMNRVEGLTYREIAGVLGLSQKAVEKRMKNALDMLKKTLKRNE